MSSTWFFVIASNCLLMLSCPFLLHRPTVSITILIIIRESVSFKSEYNSFEMVKFNNDRNDVLIHMESQR